MSLLALGLLYVGSLAVIVRASLHPIRIPIYLSPGSFKCPQEFVKLDGPLGFSIPAWYVPGETDVVAIQVHGYLMNRCELVPTAVWLHERGIGSLLLDLGGHGTAPRPTTSLGWHERKEVLAACAFVRSQNPNAKIILIGSSMGSAACAFALAEDPCCAVGLVLDSAYCRLDEAISGWWRLFGPKWLGVLLRPASFLARFFVDFSPKDVNVDDALSRSACPVLVLHGDRDGIALPSEAQKNIDALGDRASIQWFKNCRHSEGRWEQPDLYFEALETYLRANSWLSYTSKP